MSSHLPKAPIGGPLYIRPIDIDDTEYIVCWRNNPRVRERFLYREVFTPEGHIQWMNTKVASGEVEQFMVFEGERPIGSVYFRDIDKIAGTAEYGVFIGEDDACGHGYGNIIASWAVKYAKENMGLSSIILRVLSGNTAAIRSYQNAGYKEYEVQKDYLDGQDLIFMKQEL